MLKKKMQKLAAEKNLSAQNKFEIVNDSSAAEIYGGANAQDCPKLQSCGTFSGDCPNLSLCQRYD